MTRDQLVFRVEFFAPLTSAAALSRDGYDIALHADPVGGDGIKGAMRHIATELLPSDLRDQTFGRPGRESPWHWGALESATGWRTRDRYRVKIDDTTGAAEEDMLVRAEYVWPDAAATFTVTQTGDDEACAQTRLALIASAHGVTALGAWTNRAYGWVRIRLADDGQPRELSDAELDEIWTWRETA